MVFAKIEAVNNIKRNIVVFLVNISEYNDNSYTYKLSNFNVRHILQLKITAEDRELEDRQLQEAEQLRRAQDQAATDAAQGEMNARVEQLKKKAQHPNVIRYNELQKQLEQKIGELSQQALIKEKLNKSTFIKLTYFIYKSFIFLYQNFVLKFCIISFIPLRKH